MTTGEISKALLYFPAEQGWVTISISITHPVREGCAFRLAILSAEFILSTAERLRSRFSIEPLIPSPVGSRWERSRVRETDEE
jgi:hypothetical protein